MRGRWGLRTTCKRGHPLTDDNVILRSNGKAKKSRRCRVCLLHSWRVKRIHKHGLTEEEYTQRLASQGGVCAICHTPPAEGSRLVIDHDHNCCPGAYGCGNCVRGLIHSECNSILGLAHDNPQLLRQAAVYLEESKCCLNS